MKLSTRNFSDILLAGVAASVFIVMVCFPARYAARVSEGVSLWAICVLPTTFPFLFLTLFLSKTRSFAWGSRKLAAPFSRLFRVSSAGGGASVLSLFSGYPAGARTLCDLAERGILPREERLRAAYLATTSGPAFLVGTLGTLAGSAAGWLLFGAHFVGVWGVSFLLGRRAAPCITPALPAVTAQHDAFGASLAQAVLSILTVGGAIALFYTLGHMIADALAPLALPPLLTAFLQGMVEMTSGCIALLQTPTPATLALCAFLVTFGGACILIQQWCFLQRTNIRFLPFLGGKIAQGSLAAGVAYLLAACVLG